MQSIATTMVTELFMIISLQYPPRTCSNRPIYCSGLVLPFFTKKVMISPLHLGLITSHQPLSYPFSVSSRPLSRHLERTCQPAAPAGNLTLDTCLLVTRVFQRAVPIKQHLLSLSRPKIGHIRKIDFEVFPKWLPACVSTLVSTVANTLLLPVRWHGVDDGVRGSQLRARL